MDFERRIKKDFLKLKELCYDAQRFRSSTTTIQKAQELKEKIEEKERSGYTNQKERDDLQRQFEEQQKKVEQAEKQLGNVTKKIETSDSPLKSVIEKLKPEPKQNGTAEKQDNDGTKSDIEPPKKVKYRTDKPIYSNYNKKEKKLIGRIYAAIGNAIADERLREALISNIEEEITK